MSFRIHLATSRLFTEGPSFSVQLRITEPVDAGQTDFIQAFSEVPSPRMAPLAAHSMIFPLPGRVEFAELDLDAYAPSKKRYPIALWLKLEGPKLPLSTGFIGSAIGSNDALALFAFHPRSFAGQILHRADEGKLERCLVSCADGKTAHPCVTCKSGDVLVRICC